MTALTHEITSTELSEIVLMRAPDLSTKAMSKLDIELEGMTPGTEDVSLSIALTVDIDPSGMTIDQCRARLIDTAARALRTCSLIDPDTLRDDLRSEYDL